MLITYQSGIKSQKKLKNITKLYISAIYLIINNIKTLKILREGREGANPVSFLHPFSVMVWGALLAAAGHHLKWTPDH